MIMNNRYIAMWSGPRNISTAMMRSFESRDDTVVIDEPFYAHFLHKTKFEHPGKKEILLSQDCNWDRVVDMITGPIPDDKAIWYQKHMAQHNLDGCNLEWIKKFNNCFLIRNPKYVIHSYSKEYIILNERQLGYIQQQKLIKKIEESTGETPPIFDADDILKNPKAMLEKICKSVGISFSKKMLKWDKGGRNSDGVWSKYWYKNVINTTGFKPYQKKKIKLEKEVLSLYEKCMVYYNIMYDKRLTV